MEIEETNFPDDVSNQGSGTSAKPIESADDDLRDLLRLVMVSGVGPLTRRSLMARFGSPQAILSASLFELRQVNGVGPKLAQAIRAARTEIDIDTEMQLCRDANITLLSETDVGFPRSLTEIPDPPGILFVKGDLLEQDSLAVAIVGTRHATAYGLKQAERLAAGLARTGITIVSGLARGIDSAAHRAALGAGGRTLAVLGSGILDIYPPENADLAMEITKHGALISEAPPRMPPISGMFPQRNRLITGLSLGVVIIEAAQRSGALISARHAVEQGREVFAVPGRVDSRMSQGCHRLIRDGAKLVESVEDILEELGPLSQPAPSRDGRMVSNPVELQLNTQEQAVLTAIDHSATGIDEIVRRSRLPVNRVLATISVLEMRRLIRRLSGNSVARI